ncbi:hypothetical protein AOLI_G00010070 [Acnodon oligacanthus]
MITSSITPGGFFMLRSRLSLRISSQLCQGLYYLKLHLPAPAPGFRHRNAESSLTLKPSARLLVATF